DSAEAMTMADETPAISGQHDMDAVAPEPRSLIEAVTGPARKFRFGANLEDATLWGRPAERKLELRPLGEAQQPETPHAHGHPQVEAATPRRGRDDDEGALGAADLRPQRAGVEAIG